MKMLRITSVAVMLTAILVSSATAVESGDFDWSVQYMIDNTQTVMGVDQSDCPRNNRGLALSPDGQYLYAGYNNPEGDYCVRKIDLSQPDYTDATVANLVGVSRGKAIAVDDVGRVYLAESTGIKIYDANLSSELYSITDGSAKFEGVALTRESGQLILYSSDRNTGELTRYQLTESGGTITDYAVDIAWGTNGVITLSDDLRGLEIDSLGRTWVADNDDGCVYVVSADGLSYQTIGSVENAMDIGFYGDIALVTQYTECQISQFNVSDLSSAGAVLTAPLDALQLTATPATGGDGALAGIAVIDGVGFYVAGEGINTADEMSIYGRIDENSGYYEGAFYTDLYNDDNDSILFAAVPEPGMLLLLTVAALGLFAYVRRGRWM